MSDKSLPDDLQVAADAWRMKAESLENRLVAAEATIEKLKDEVTELEDFIESMPSQNELDRLAHAIKNRNWPDVDEEGFRCGLRGL